MRVLITGSSGFIGKNLLLAVPEGWKLFILHHDNFWEQILSWPSRIDIGIHLAGNGDPTLSAENVSYDLLANTLFTVQLFSHFDFDKFIYFSSGAVYDGLEGEVNPSIAVNPTLPYAISKLASELYLKYFKKIGKIKELAIVRFFGAYGPHEPERKIYSRLVKQFGIDGNPDFTIRGDGTNLIDAMFVDDAVRAILQITENMPNQEIIDLYAGYPMTIETLVRASADIFGIDSEIKYEGETAEPIHFWSNDKSFPFKPEVNLEDGLLELRDWILSKEENV
jgi:nucleoside-diphosphate-sugar epimerase